MNLLILFNGLERLLLSILYTTVYIHVTTIKYIKGRYSPPGDYSMVPRQQVINKDVVERVRKRIEKEYAKLAGEPVSQGGITLVTALGDEEIEKLVLLALKEARQPVSWRELKLIFAGIAGEDRLRRILNILKANNVIAELTRTRYALPEYVPSKELQKVKNPGIISRILKAKQGESQ